MFINIKIYIILQQKFTKHKIFSQTAVEYLVTSNGHRGSKFNNKLQYIKAVKVGYHLINRSPRS